MGSSNATLCPDGSYVNASRCTLCPNGSYVGGNSCTLTPGGTYVSGGYGTTLCPDGSYVGGNRCTLCPDGTYSGGRCSHCMPVYCTKSIVGKTSIYYCGIYCDHSRHSFKGRCKQIK